MKIVSGIYLPDDDTHFEAHLIKNPLYMGKGTYQLNKLELALEHVSFDRRVAVDIGGHVGTWSRVLSYMFDTVYVFEPVMENYECLVENCRDRKNVITYQNGVSDRAKEVQFSYVPGNSGNSGSSFSSDNGELVHCVALDSLNLENVDFIKIDVEGLEFEVVQGMEDTLKRCKPTVIIEQKPGNAERQGYTRFAARDYLLSQGMDTVASKSGDYVLKFLE